MTAARVKCTNRLCKRVAIARLNVDGIPGTWHACTAHRPDMVKALTIGQAVGTYVRESAL